MSTDTWKLVRATSRDKSNDARTAAKTTCFEIRAAMKRYTEHYSQQEIPFATFDYEPATDGVYKLTLKKPMPPGEYGLVGPGGSTGYEIYDFGIGG